MSRVEFPDLDSMYAWLKAEKLFLGGWDFDWTRLKEVRATPNEGCTVVMRS